jgi:hypothetical protein
MEKRHDRRMAGQTVEWKFDERRTSRMMSIVMLAKHQLHWPTMRRSATQQLPIVVAL